MGYVIRGFAAQGVVACFSEPSLNGSPTDWNAGRNAPARTPNLYLPNIIFHSDFFQYELLVPIQSLSVSFASVPVVSRFAGAGPAGGGIHAGGSFTGVGVQVYGNEVITLHTIYTHNLGYIPKVFLAFNGSILTSGTIIYQSGNTARFASVYATTTQVILRVASYSSNVVLPAVTLSFQLMIFRNPAKNAALPLYQKVGSRMTLGRGKIDTDKRYLRRVAAAESSFDLDLGRTIDIRNGRTRHVSGGVTRSEGGYNGSFSGSPYIPVGV